ncbi:LysR substrate-binding domain-containing protein [Vibrio sinaloensis]|nr:LysR substrate-binding domain-containing protein [Vibrio sinaloensis]
MAKKQLTFTNAKGEVTKLQHAPRVQVRTSISVREFVLNDLGFAIMPSFMVQEALEQGQVMRILPEVHNHKNPFVCCVSRKKAMMPLRVRALIDFLKQQSDAIG